MYYPLAFHLPFLDQSAVILILGLLIFGKRLPEVGRSLGKGIVEFKRGIKGIEDEVEAASDAPPTQSILPRPVTAQTALPTGNGAAAYKFDPHTGAAIQPAVPAGAKFDPFTGKPIETVDAEVVDAGAGGYATVKPNAY